MNFSLYIFNILFKFYRRRGVYISYFRVRFKGTCNLFILTLTQIVFIPLIILHNLTLWRRMDVLLLCMPIWLYLRIRILMLIMSSLIVIISCLGTRSLNVICCSLLEIITIILNSNLFYMILMLMWIWMYRLVLIMTLIILLQMRIVNRSRLSRGVIIFMFVRLLISLCMWIQQPRRGLSRWKSLILMALCKR